MVYDEFIGHLGGAPEASRTLTSWRPVAAVRDWFGGRPRLRYAVWIVAAFVWALANVGVIAGIFGAIFAVLLMVVVSLAGLGDAGAIDVFQSNWERLVGLAAVFAASAGLMWVLQRCLGLGSMDPRPRNVIARDLVAQGVVAAALGCTRVQIRLGIFGSGSLQYSVRASLDAIEEVEHRFNLLVIQMANPSVGRSFERGGERQRRSWVAEISATASDVMIRAAAAGLSPESEATLIDRAARRAHAILQAGDPERSRMEFELQVHGYLRIPTGLVGEGAI